MKITKQSCSGTVKLDKDTAAAFTIADNGCLSLEFASFEEALCWLKLVDFEAEVGTKAPPSVQERVTTTIDTATVVVVHETTTTVAPEAVTTSTPEPAEAVPVSTPAPVEAVQEAAEATPSDAPKRRGRPKGSKNKKATEGGEAKAEADSEDKGSEPVSAKPTFTPPAHSPAPAAIPAAVKPAAPSKTSAVVKKSTIMVGKAGWGVEISTDGFTHTAKCTQIPSLTGSGDSEEEALKDIRQLIANYMRDELSANVEIDADAPVTVVKQPKQDRTLPKTVLEASGPAVAVYEYILATVTDKRDADVAYLSKCLIDDWGRIPTLRDKTVWTEDKLSTLIPGYLNRAHAALSKPDDDDAAAA